MAINRPGELVSDSVLMFYDHVELSFSHENKTLEAYKGSRKGAVYLLPNQVVFESKNRSDALKSFTMPISLMNHCEIKKPKLRASYIKGTIAAEPNGGWEGSATFKLTFTSGGAIEFGQLMLRSASQASRGEIPAGRHGCTYFSNSASGMASSMGAPVYPPPCAIFAYPPPPPVGFYPGPPPTEGTMNYMAPPPYPGPMTLPGGDALLPQTLEAEARHAEGAGSTCTSQSIPHSMPAPMDQPPPYTPRTENQGQQSDQPWSTVPQPSSNWRQQ
ncbi:WW domain-binding protein 2-like isoform X2 [Heterodontus francisci]|uniref:WW domain-binding protein 2-like isoform X2 n=2 Tax=Heterodontus francisci TaxID=7792 RepID=UPI00355C7D8B